MRECWVGGLAAEQPNSRRFRYVGRSPPVREDFMHLSVVHRRSVLLATAVALVLPFVVPTLALAQADDGAGVGVARISLLAGSVAVQRGDADTPSAAVINAPVLGGDYLTTGDDSRAEVQMDGGTIVRLGQNVQMRFSRLDGDARAIQVAEGTVELRLM